jgi:hypothetical protein
VTAYGGNLGWSCLSTQSCQDVFDFEMEAGSVLSIRISNVSAGSVAQIALYGPGTPLGGINLLTGNNKELRCTTGADCNGYTAGEQVTGFTLSQTGVYRLAVTRDWNNSCDPSGTYRVDISSSVAFKVLGVTGQDRTSLASGHECHGPVTVTGNR